MSYLSTFTTYIQEFIDKLCGHYPEDKDFSNFKAYIIILKKTNPRAILNLFNTHCIKYTEQIKTKDEKFLLKFIIIKKSNFIFLSQSFFCTNELIL